MKALDRYIRARRIRQALPFLRPGSRVLDIGCFDASLFEALGESLGEGLGLDPLIEEPLAGPRWRLQRGALPSAEPPGGPFDAVTMLAVLEHVPDQDLQPLAEQISSLLAPSGRLILTVPSPSVDHILVLLRAFRLIDGMSLEEHHAFDPGTTRRLFESAGLPLLLHRRFQLGLNNLFVFEKPAQAG